MAQLEATVPPEEFKFVGAAKQRSGPVVLHLNSMEAATWLKENMAPFLAAMGGTSSYKQRLLNVVVEYVPVTFDPNRDGALHVVEGDNGYRSGSILKARYIKPVERRRKGQTVAHLVVGFEDAPTAN
ncbi:hypothetical protein C8R43DRAFT_901320, partial [Mycena crocata]